MIVVLSILLASLLIPNMMFLVETLVGLQRRRPRPRAQLGLGNDAIIIVPAHDEANVIERTLQGLKIAAEKNFSILVVADNCGDDTAGITRRLGITVIERHEPEKRGKGYALAFARDWLRAKPPSAIIILDADCRTNADSLCNLAAACGETNEAWQAINLLEPSSSASPMVQISTFAFLIKNLVRQRGLQRLTGGVHLTGTGMCLPWHQFDKADLATASIVEDMRLGIELSRVGARPQLAEDSYVWSAHAELKSSLAQRSRWEGGFLALAWSAAPEILVRGVRNMAPRTILSGLDLLIPPLSILGMFNAAALLLSGAMAAAGLLSWALASAFAVVNVLVGSALFLAWFQDGRGYLSLKTLLQLPFYVIWKLPMYFGLLKRGKPTEWLRTERPPETDREA